MDKELLKILRQINNKLGWIILWLFIIATYILIFKK